MSKNKKSSYVKNKIKKTNKYKQLKEIKIMKKNSFLVKQVLMSIVTEGKRRTDEEVGQPVSTLSHKESEPRGPLFFAPSGRWPAYRRRYEGIIISNGKRNISKVKDY